MARGSPREFIAQFHVVKHAVNECLRIFVVCQKLWFEIADHMFKYTLSFFITG